jgi:hypothetical protein
LLSTEKVFAHFLTSCFWDGLFPRRSNLLLDGYPSVVSDRLHKDRGLATRTLKKMVMRIGLAGLERENAHTTLSRLKAKQLTEE